MRKFKIVNKKIFATFIAVVVLLIVGAAFGGYKLVAFIYGRGYETAKRQDVAAGAQPESAARDAEKKNEVQGGQKKEVASTPVAATEYHNQRYGYVMSFPDSWTMSNDTSESQLAEMEIDAGVTIRGGGETLWSNYKNMDDFSPDQKPADFHLLNLTMYEKQGVSSDEIAALLGYSDGAGVKKEPFSAQNISGTEYVAIGEDTDNPMVTIIFQKGDLFYAFNLGFIGGDPTAVSTMEDIVATFAVN